MGRHHRAAQGRRYDVEAPDFGPTGDTPEEFWRKIDAVFSAALDLMTKSAP